MAHSMDMSKERPVDDFFEEGLTKFKIVSCDETTSKAGNLMFVVGLEEPKTLKNLTAYCIGEPKKRWLLKGLLDACNIGAAKDGVYDWDVSNLVGVGVIANIKNEDNEWVNREGDTIVTPKSRVANFKKVSE